jgi:hypothetical protein
VNENSDPNERSVAHGGQTLPFLDEPAGRVQAELVRLREKLACAQGDCATH